MTATPRPTELRASWGLQPTPIKVAVSHDDVPQQPFDVGRFLKQHIRYEVEFCKENVIVDLSCLLEPQNREALRHAVDEAGLAAHVRWYG